MRQRGIVIMALLSLRIRRVLFKELDFITLSDKE